MKNMHLLKPFLLFLVLKKVGALENDTAEAEKIFKQYHPSFK